ncbi:hypothetical protein RI367_000718 [Sorochytrium milnesiophthora]
MAYQMVARKLADCEAQIDLASLADSHTSNNYELRKKHFPQTVIAIHEIVESKLYKARKPSLEAYFKDRFAISRAQVYRFMDSALVLQSLDNVDPVPCRERQCRAIKKVTRTRNHRLLLWLEVLGKYGKISADSVTSTQIEQLWKDMVRRRVVDPLEAADDDFPGVIPPSSAEPNFLRNAQPVDLSHHHHLHHHHHQQQQHLGMGYEAGSSVAGSAGALIAPPFPNMASSSSSSSSSSSAHQQDYVFLGGSGNASGAAASMDASLSADSLPPARPRRSTRKRTRTAYNDYEQDEDAMAAALGDDGDNTPGDFDYSYNPDNVASLDDEGRDVAAFLAGQWAASSASQTAENTPTSSPAHGVSAEMKAYASIAATTAASTALERTLVANRRQSLKQEMLRQQQQQQQPPPQQQLRQQSEGGLVFSDPSTDSTLDASGIYTITTPPPTNVSVSLPTSTAAMYTQPFVTTMSSPPGFVFAHTADGSRYLPKPPLDNGAPLSSFQPLQHASISSQQQQQQQQQQAHDNPYYATSMPFSSYSMSDANTDSLSMPFETFHPYAPSSSYSSFLSTTAAPSTVTTAAVGAAGSSLLYGSTAPGHAIAGALSSPTSMYSVPSPVQTPDMSYAHTAHRAAHSRKRSYSQHQMNSESNGPTFSNETAVSHLAAADSTSSAAEQDRKRRRSAPESFQLAPPHQSVVGDVSPSLGARSSLASALTSTLTINGEPSGAIGGRRLSEVSTAATTASVADAGSPSFPALPRQLPPLPPLPSHTATASHADSLRLPTVPPPTSYSIMTPSASPGATLPSLTAELHGTPHFVPSVPGDDFDNAGGSLPAVTEPTAVAPATQE